LIALVWAFSELLGEQMKGEGIYELYHQQAKAAAQCSKPQRGSNRAPAWLDRVAQDAGEQRMNHQVVSF